MRVTWQARGRENSHISTTLDPTSNRP